VVLGLEGVCAIPRDRCAPEFSRGSARERRSKGPACGDAKTRSASLREFPCPATPSAAVLRDFVARATGPRTAGVVDGCPPGLGLTESDIQKTSTAQARQLPPRDATARSPTASSCSPVFSMAAHRHRDRFPYSKRGSASEDYSALADTFRAGTRGLHVLAKYGLRYYRGAAARRRARPRYASPRPDLARGCRAPHSVGAGHLRDRPAGDAYRGSRAPTRAAAAVVAQPDFCQYV